MTNFQELNATELISIEGGSWLSDQVCWFAGAFFGSPAGMAINGAAGHEIMGTK